jgi:hypothetical protein
MSRAKDIVVDNYGVSLTIRAVYIDRDISQYKIESIGQEQREMSGVIYVGIEENKNQVRNNLFQPAVY